MIDNRPLPPGWIQEFDCESGHPFWVDTQAKPPRSIWTHPLDDPQFLATNPEYHESEQKDHKAESDPKGSYAPQYPPNASNNTTDSEERGFIDKLKDAFLGTKEEREAKAAWRDAEIARRIEEHRMKHPRSHGYPLPESPAPFGGPGSMWGGPTGLIGGPNGRLFGPTGVLGGPNSRLTGPNSIISGPNSVISGPGLINQFRRS